MQDYKPFQAEYHNNAHSQIMGSMPSWMCSGVWVILIFVWTAGGCQNPGSEVKVSDVQWSCDRRPCQVDFTLENLGSGKAQVEVEVRGYNYMVGLSEERPRIFAGMRLFHETLEPGETKQLEKTVRFVRFPDEIEVKVLRAAS